ncbi:PREDICTED: uncharacterized protein LOC102013922 isoform X1 [Chinchilla lanigera]|uniref:uncharacterized protein LOC102013922 isoform X1 n=1 Tax=Chinchilla lanigera TaxID=34839 RepID=UPI00038EF13F|nr:PREDICTED: uncharacterized protein LOC102013922 isoform X1 [Chinchilla lanigera]
MEVLGIPAASALLPQHINQPEPCRCALQTLCHLLPVQNTGRRLACLGSGWPCSADARDNARQLFSSALPSTGIRGLARPFCLRLKMRICGLKWRPASLAAGSADRTIWRPSEELPGPGCSAQAGLHAALSSQPDEGGACWTSHEDRKAAGDGRGIARGTDGMGAAPGRFKVSPWVPCLEEASSGVSFQMHGHHPRQVAPAMPERRPAAQPRSGCSRVLCRSPFLGHGGHVLHKLLNTSPPGTFLWALRALRCFTCTWTPCSLEFSGEHEGKWNCIS